MCVVGHKHQLNRLFRSAAYGRKRRTKLNNLEFQEREGKCNELEFPSAFVGMEALDLPGKFFIGALVLGVLRDKLTPATGEPLAESRQRLAALE